MYNKVMDYFTRAKKFRAKKRLGQNFLVDEKVIDEILSCVNDFDFVFEIGPGLGFVTERLVEKAKDVTAVEIDKDAIKILNENLSDKKKFTLIENDILKVNLDEIYPHERKIKVIANIPYYITSPILVHLLGEIDDLENKNRNHIDEIILMVQLEVAKRICANEKSQNKEYGMLSILSQFFCDTEIIRHVSKRSFYPSPKVDSALVRIKNNNKPKIENPSPLLKKTIKAAFNTRRKNIKNSLLSGGLVSVKEALSRIGMDDNTRGEKSAVVEFHNVTCAVEACMT